MGRQRLSRHRRRYLGYATGIVVSLTFVGVASLPQQEHLRALGAMNVGHEQVRCTSCHTYAPGSMRQQLQANIRYVLGWRLRAADFGRQAVGNTRCLACHERPNDRHPVFRFVEPRFKTVREQLKPHQCLSCHREHTGKRITQAHTFCIHCHQDTTLKSDPIDMSHAHLIATNRWDTCLQCHDFHGNHVMLIATAMEQAIPVEQILAYFDGGPSPYSRIKKYKAKIEETSYVK